MTEGWAILKDSSPKSPASLRHRPYNLGRAPIGTQVDDGITTQIAWALEFGQPARPFNGIGSRVRGETASSQMAMIDELLGLLGRIGEPQPSSPHRRSDVLSESMTHEEGMVWLASQGGFLKHTLTREGVEQVMASAHGLATCTVVKDLSDAAEVWRCEMEAIEELWQIFEG